MNPDIFIDFKDEYDESFRNEVLDALDLLPEHFQKQLNNVSIVIEENQPKSFDGFLLGLYHGVPNPFKGLHYTFVLPDKISLFKKNIIIISEQRNIPLKQVIAEVLYHEIGHYFGLSEQELDHFKTF